MRLIIRDNNQNDFLIPLQKKSINILFSLSLSLKAAAV